MIEADNSNVKKAKSVLHVNFDHVVLFSSKTSKQAGLALLGFE
jgi:hypothetical protein